MRRLPNVRQLGLCAVSIVHFPVVETTFNFLYPNSDEMTKGYTRTSCLSCDPTLQRQMPPDCEPVRRVLLSPESTREVMTCAGGARQITAGTTSRDIREHGQTFAQGTRGFSLDSFLACSFSVSETPSSPNRNLCARRRRNDACLGAFAA